MVPKATLAGSNGILPGELIFAGEEAIALADKALMMMTKRYGRGSKTTLDALTGKNVLFSSSFLFNFPLSLLVSPCTLPAFFTHTCLLTSYIHLSYHHTGLADILDFLNPLYSSPLIYTYPHTAHIHTLSLCLYPLIPGLADILDFFGGRDEAKAELAIRYYEEAIVLQERHGIEFVAYKKEQLSFICNKYVR